MSDNYLSAGGGRGEMPVMTALPGIVISRQVLARLDAILDTSQAKNLGTLGTFLLDEITRAEVVDDHDLPPQVVSPNRRVRFRDLETDHEMEATLAFPEDVGKTEEGISVLTVVGAALLGLSEGQAIDYETPDGRRKSLVVVKVLPPRKAEPISP